MTPSFCCQSCTFEFLLTLHHNFLSEYPPFIFHRISTYVLPNFTNYFLSDFFTYRSDQIPYSHHTLNSLPKQHNFPFLKICGISPHFSILVHVNWTLVIHQMFFLIFYPFIYRGSPNHSPLTLLCKPCVIQQKIVFFFAI